MFETLERIFDLALIEELFGKYDWLGIIDVMKAFELYENYKLLGETEVGAKILTWSAILLVFRMLLASLALIFFYRVWRIVANFYFEIEKEQNKEKVEPKLRRIPKNRNNLQKIQICNNPEKIQISDIHKEKPTNDTTKEIELPQKTKKQDLTLKEKIVKFLFNEE